MNATIFRHYCGVETDQWPRSAASRPELLSFV